MAKGLLLLVALYGAIVLLMGLAQRKMMYFPGAAVPPPAVAGVPEMAVVSVRTADGLDLLAWYAPPGAPGAPVIAYFHGNAGTVALRAGRVRPYLDAGLGVLLLEYRGYGGNPGAPSETGLFADAAGAAAFLAARGIGPERTVAYGESLGSGVAVWLAHDAAAKRAPLAAVVLEAGFSSAADLAQHHYSILPARWLVRDRYQSITRIGAIGAPLLMIHGTHDPVVPLVFARRLFDQAGEPKAFRLLDGGGHDDLDLRGGPEAVLAFLAGLGLVVRAG